MRVASPGDKFDERFVERHPGLGVEDGREGAAEEVAGHHLFVGEAQDAQHGALGGLAHSQLDLVVGGFPRQPGGRAGHALHLDSHIDYPLRGTGEVDDGHVGHRHSEGHARQLALQRGDDLGDRFRCASLRRDDVLLGASAVAPVLWGEQKIIRKHSTIKRRFSLQYYVNIILVGPVRTFRHM
ncbi:Putative secreted protein [Gryllus bimaculatus]|nr:Putative secreted protein [Gryllus bimaculatus]